ncbi:MAG: glycosyltransferase family 39 protein, partial [Chloroflexi bacterium]|nr:glycosyltransferase family 39 protein [Chloroflexota bacterium]
LGSAHVSQAVFYGLPHVEDEHAFLFQAKVLASGRLFVQSPPDPKFFPTQFVIDKEGKRFGKYPPGYPLVLSLGVLAGQPRLETPLLGAPGLFVVFLIGRELYGSLVGLLAAGLGAVSPFFFMQSGSYMSHAATLLFVALFVLFFVKGRRSTNPVFAVLAGASLGMGFITRQLTAAGIAVPFVLYALVDLRRGWRSVIKYGLMSLAFAVFAGFLLYYNRVLTGNPFLNPYELWWPFDKVGFGPKEGGGHTLAAGWVEAQINFNLLSDYLFGWPARLSLAFVVVPFLALSRKLWDWLLLGSAACLMIAYMAYWTSGEMYGPRYNYEALPMLLLLTARGVVEVWRGLSWALRRLADRVAPRRRGGTEGVGRVIAGAVVALALAALIFRGIGEYLPKEMAHFTGWYGITSAPVDAVRRAGIHNALVFVNGARSWTEFATLDAGNSPDYNSNVVFAADLGPENGKLMLLYPDRQYYRIVGTTIKPYAESIASTAE